MLTSFEIRNFRVFSHLVLHRLARVNLVVGKNNVGKTCLLEALRLYDCKGSVQAIEGVLASRNEVRIDPERQRVLPMLDMLFHKRTSEEGWGGSPQLAMGPQPASDDAHEWLFISGHDVAIVGPGRHGGDVLSVGSLSVSSGSETVGIACEELFSKGGEERRVSGELPFLTAAPVSEDLVAHWWDAIVFTDLKNDVIKTLQSLDPSVLDVGFVAHPLDRYRRMAMVRTSRAGGPLALRTLGDGVVRVFALATALQYRGIWQERGGIGRALLIDEVENGIHHSFHASLWRSLFRLAQLNDVQVFATTHSLDCLRGFARALEEDEQNDGLVIRLEKIEGEEKTGAVLIDREDLPIVVRDSIEVR